MPGSRSLPKRQLGVVVRAGEAKEADKLEALEEKLQSLTARLEAAEAEAEQLKKSKKAIDTFEDSVETVLYSSRFFVSFAVVGSVTIGAALFIKGLMAVEEGVMALIHGQPEEVTMTAIAVLDDFLTGCATLVFGMGLYELFISRLNVIHGEKNTNPGTFYLDARPEWLHVKGLHDLKHRTGAVVVMVMVVNVFEATKKIEVTEPVQIVYLALAALLSAASVFVIGAEPPHGAHEEVGGGHSSAGAKHHDEKKSSSSNHH